MSLEDSLSAGPLRIPFWLLAVVAALAVLKLVLKLTLPAEAKKWENSVWNALVAGFVVWKLSPLLSAWESIIKQPLTLLYLPGNNWGLGAAIFTAVVWLGVKFWSAKTPSGKLLLALGGSLGASALSIGVFAGILALVPAKPALPQNSLTLSTLNGREAVLSQAPGKVLFVNFWATWCPPCRAEIPEFVDFWSHADTSGVAIQAVDLSASEPDLGKVAPFVQSEGMLFPVLLDNQGLAAKQYAIESIPTTLVFDPAGNVVFRHTGAMTRDMMETLVRQYRR